MIRLSKGIALLRKESQKKIYDIEFLRGLAIVYTLVAHSIVVSPDSAILIAFLSSHWLGSGVDLFFVISGFVITASLRDQMSRIWLSSSSREELGPHSVRDRLAPIRKVLVAFWIRRAFRLLPSAFLTVFLTLAFLAFFSPRAVGGVLGGFRLQVEASLAAALQLFNFWEWRQLAAGGELSLIGQFWSLSLEEQFYFVFPFIMIASGSLRRLGLVAGLIVAGFFFVPKTLPSDLMWWFRVDGLFWGVAIACFRPKLAFLDRLGGAPKHAFALLLLIICGLGLTETIIRLYDWKSANGVMLLFAATLVFFAAANRDLFRFGPFGGLLFYFGERSYLIYLMHKLIFAIAQLIGEAAQRATSSSAWASAAQGLFLLASLAPLELLHRQVEIRFRDVGRRIAGNLVARSAKKYTTPTCAESTAK
jgi:peptidoglycan/LPS O-acetylase OafA/YrhL